MFFSKTCEYAIRATLFITRKTKTGGKVGIKEIAAGINSPEHFIAKILQDLRKFGLISSTKGPNGGFYSDERTGSLTLADIVKAIDGERIFSRCGLGLPACSEVNPCPLHDEFKAIRKQMHTTLHQVTIFEFSERLDQT